MFCATNKLRLSTASEQAIYRSQRIKIHCSLLLLFLLFPKNFVFWEPCLRDAVCPLTLGAFADTQKSLISSCVVHDRNPMNPSRLAQGELWFPPWQSERKRYFALSALLQRTPKAWAVRHHFPSSPLNFVPWHGKEWLYKWMHRLRTASVRIA